MIHCPRNGLIAHFLQKCNSSTANRQTFCRTYKKLIIIFHSVKTKSAYNLSQPLKVYRNVIILKDVTDISQHFCSFLWLPMTSSSWAPICCRHPSFLSIWSYLELLASNFVPPPLWCHRAIASTVYQRLCCNGHHSNSSLYHEWRRILAPAVFTGYVSRPLPFQLGCSFDYVWYFVSSTIYWSCDLSKLLLPPYVTLHFE